MINLTDVRQVKALQSNLRVMFESPQGKEVMLFLEEACGWYRSILDPLDRDSAAFINDGKRQVLATIKTLLELPPDQIVAMAKEKERAE